MKTAVSIPDPIFQAADDLARRLGMSRSQLYATAVSRFVNIHKNEAVTAALNEIYEDTESAVDPTLAQMQCNSLPETEW